MVDTVFASEPETILRVSPGNRAKATNHVLMGTRLNVVESAPDFFRVVTMNRSPGGRVNKNHVSPSPGLKIFYVDVGQGDGAIIESLNGAILLDGGPNTGFYKYLRHRYKPMLDAGEKVHFDALIVSHPDMDHFYGLTKALSDPDFSFGTIFHNGIIRYKDDVPAGMPFDLGELKSPQSGRKVLTETFSALIEAGELIDTGNLMSTFNSFRAAAWNASVDGRLDSAKRLTVRKKTVPGFSTNNPEKLRIEIPGPVPTTSSGKAEYETFPDSHDHPGVSPSSSHTRNGHSLVLKFIFGEHSFLFGGDLNIPAENHLIAHHGADTQKFRADVTKAYHHGSSDFTVDFLKLIKPKVNVISSGDNKSFDHPVADAPGAIGRHASGTLPLMFSTEIARATSKSGRHYGLINARSNVKKSVDGANEGTA